MKKIRIIQKQTSGSASSNKTPLSQHMIVRIPANKSIKITSKQKSR